MIIALKCFKFKMLAGAYKMIFHLTKQLCVGV